jgi:phytoene synthase
VTRDDSAHFVAKWLEAEPWHRLLLVFESQERCCARQLIEALGYELRHTALDSSDARVVAAKIGWWLEEWRLLAAGTPRHPLTIALAAIGTGPIAAQAGSAWIGAAARLADDVSDANAQARIERWQAYTQAQAQASMRWLPAASDEARCHAAVLLMERIAHAQADLEQGRLPVPLDVMAGRSLTRMQLAQAGAETGPVWVDYADRLADTLRRSTLPDPGSYRRAQAALTDLRASWIRRHPQRAGRQREWLPPLRSAFAVWRAFRLS